MNRFAAYAIAAACGIVAACFYLAVVFGTPGAMILAYLAQLPLFFAGLWLGTTAAVVGGATGSMVLFAASDLLGAAVFAGINAVPVIVLVRQSLLARRREDGAFSWYPPGLMVAWLTGMGLAGIALAVLFLGGPQGLRDAVRDLLDPVLERLGRGADIANRDQVVGTLSTIVPGMVAASCMMMTIVNGALAQGVLSRFKLNWRPSPSLVALALPLWVPIVLGLAAGATVIGGSARFVGINVMIALFVPFCLAGLAVVHLAARRLSHPSMALVIFYTIAGLFGWPFLAVAILGLLESGLGLRRRLVPHGVNIDG